MLQEILKAVRKDNSTIILREVAHGKPAEESSVYGGAHSAPRAVDGNLNTIMHTNLEQSPYWMVDLGKNYQIKRIEIFNLIDGAKSTEGKGTFVIETSKRLVSWNTILTASSIIECSRLCAKNGDCCSASYNEKSMLCYLNNECPPEMENDTNSKTIIRTCRKPEGRPIDCNDIPDTYPSGVYKVFPNQTEGFDVFCEMNSDEGHWTVFQRRENGYVDFYRGWNEYKAGFGNLNHEFWLGNDNLHSLTSQHNYEMRIDLVDFDGNTAFAKYKVFSIGDESSKFKLTANEYHGTAGNSLEYHNGHRFSTKDSDNDNHLENNCATMFLGAWWFDYCLVSDLNGQYFLKTPDSPHRGVYWRAWKGKNYSLKGSLMMMRRVSNHT